MASERHTPEQTSTSAVHAEPTDSGGNHDLIAHAVRKDGLTTAQKWKDHRMKIGRALGIDDDKKLKNLVSAEMRRVREAGAGAKDSVGPTDADPRAAKRIYKAAYKKSGFSVFMKERYTDYQKLRKTDPTANYTEQRYAKQWTALSAEAKLNYDRLASRRDPPKQRALSDAELKKRKEQGFKKLRSAMDELGSLGVQVLSYQFDEKKNFGGWIIEGEQAGQVASEIDGFNGVSPAILFPTFVGQAQVNAIKLKNSISK